MSGRLVRDINPSGSSSPDNLVAVNGLIYFSADLGTIETTNTTSSTQAESSGGNSTGDDASDINSNTPQQTLGTGIGLIRSDGSHDGTILLKTFDSIDSLTPIGDTIYFIANNGDGHELWKSNGTVRGTKRERVLYPQGSDQTFPPSLFEIDGSLFFSAIDQDKYPEDNGYELWRWDGEGVGQRFFRNIRPDKLITDITITDATEDKPATATVTTEIFENDSFPDNFTEINGNFFFTAWSSSLYSNETAQSPILIGGLELFYTDGTENGTKPININQQTYQVYDPQDGEYSPTQVSSPDFGFVPLSGSSFPRELVAFGSQLYFVANDGLNGFELWSINDLGEESSLTRISNLLDNKRSSSPEELTIAGDSLYFTANDGKKNRKLYQFNDNLSEPKAVENSGLNPRNLSEVDGQLFYSAESDEGRELWSVTGSKAERVQDINSGSGSSSPGNFTTITRKIKGEKQKILYFTADDGKRGIEVWSKNLKKDGTPAKRVTDLEAGPISSDPRSLLNSDQRLFFTAQGKGLGRELWTLGPAIEGPNGSAGSARSQTSIEENTKFVYTFELDDGSAARWSINGGADADLFKIQKKKGKLKFLKKPNFEKPKDDEKDNQYNLFIRATDKSSGLVSDQKVSVNVLDAEENESGDGIVKATNNNNTASIDSGSEPTLFIESCGPISSDGVCLYNQVRKSSTTLARKIQRPQASLSERQENLTSQPVASIDLIDNNLPRSGSCNLDDEACFNALSTNSSDSAHIVPESY